MKSYPIPKNFCGSKLKTRYKLTEDDFWADDKFIYILKKISDDPPVFEAPDPKKPPIKDRIDSAETLSELKEILKEVL